MLLFHLFDNVTHQTVSECLQCFDTVGWVSGRSSGLDKKLSHEVLVWLSVWIEVQMVCICSSWCHCHPIISCFIKIHNGLTFLVPAYPGCLERACVKWMSICKVVIVAVTASSMQHSLQHVPLILSQVSKINMQSMQNFVKNDGFEYRVKCRYTKTLSLVADTCVYMCL